MAEKQTRAGSVSPTRKRAQWLTFTSDSPPDSPRPVSYTFARAGRFRSVPRNSDCLQLVLPSTFNPRSTSFGFGQRWTPINPAGKDSPPPNNYRQPSDFDSKRNVGYSFGAKLESYGDVYRRRELPGPGTYRVTGDVGKTGPKFSIRQKVTVVHYSDSPAPGTYRPSESLTKDGRFNTINFGFGRRISLANKGTSYPAVAANPGPGSYDVRQLFKDFDRPKLFNRKRISVPGENLPTP